MNAFWKPVFVLAACAVSIVGVYHVQAQTIYPDLQKVRKPNPSPLPPGDSFSPPVSGRAGANTPRCAEWTRTARPDETLVIAGANFSRYAGIGEGRDTRFVTYSKDLIRDAKILRVETDKAVITLDKDLRDWSMYLIWPKNDAGYGEPIAVNKTDAWWVGPDKVNRGDYAAVYGRNLSHNNTTSVSYVYLLPPGGKGQWLKVKNVNPYKVDFKIPADLPIGRYELWVHNGHGGDYGWSGPLQVQVVDRPVWTSSVFNVLDYGAKGNGLTDDTEALRRTVQAASQQNGATVYFPTGRYLISNTIILADNMRWRGDGQDKTFITCSPNFYNRTSSVIYGDVTNIEIRNLSFEQHQLGKQNIIDKPIFLRGSSDVRLLNVRFYFPAFVVFDFHLADHVFIKNCQVTGNSAFLGNCSQLFIDRCTFKLTNDSDVMLFSWGGEGISLTNSTCSDLDNSDPHNGAGWGKGRFFVGSGVWGSNRFTYLGNNTTKDLTVRPYGADQNSGEQFLWEANVTRWSGGVRRSTKDTTYLSALPSAVVAGSYAVVVKGLGLGQVRRIAGVQKGSITLETPWEVNPDASSLLKIGSYADKIVVYKNVLDAKPYAATSESHIASAGIQPYGGVFNFIADGNTLNEVRLGIANWVVNGEAGADPNYFNLFCNNRIVGSRGGISNIAYVNPSDKGVGMFGIVYRRNRIINAVVSGIENSVEGRDTVIFSTMVYEHNKITGSSKGFSAALRGVENQVWYNNLLENTAGNASHPALQIEPKTVFRQNVYKGFSAPLEGPVQRTLEAPYHVIALKGYAGGKAVDSSLVLWNAGSAALTWSASSNASWLSLSPLQGKIETEKDSGLIALSADPETLSEGNYTAIVTVNTGEYRKSYTVQFAVSSGALVNPTYTIRRRAADNP